MKRKNKSKAQLRREVQAMRKDLMMGGKPIASLSLKALKTEASLLQHFLVIENDQGPTIAQKLIDAGVELPDPELLNSAQITEKLWQVIDGLANLNHFISRTDHLSDRELYHFLWSDFLNQKTCEMGEGLGIVCEEHDIVGTESRAFFKYYSEEEDLQYFSTYYGDEELPVREQPPYDRESKLPTFVKGNSRRV